MLHAFLFGSFVCLCWWPPPPPASAVWASIVLGNEARTRTLTAVILYTDWCFWQYSRYWLFQPVPSPIILSSINWSPKREHDIHLFLCFLGVGQSVVQREKGSRQRELVADWEGENRRKETHTWLTFHKMETQQPPSTASEPEMYIGPAGKLRLWLLHRRRIMVFARSAPLLMYSTRYLITMLQVQPSKQRWPWSFERSRFFQGEIRWLVAKWTLTTK